MFVVLDGIVIRDVMIVMVVAVVVMVRAVAV